MSWADGRGSPRPLYERYGFVPTGDIEDGEVVAAARDLLGPILKQAPEAVKRTKAALQAWVHGADETTLMTLDNETQAELFEHPDKFARMDAFLAKRNARKKS